MTLSLEPIGHEAKAAYIRKHKHSLSLAVLLSLSHLGHWCNLRMVLHTYGAGGVIVEISLQVEFCGNVEL